MCLSWKLQRVDKATLVDLVTSKGLAHLFELVHVVFLGNFIEDHVRHCVFPPVLNMSLFSWEKV